MRKRVFNLFISYDGTGFETALSHVDESEREECYSQEKVMKLLEQFIADGVHDWMNGHCETFEIYDEDGNLFFQFAPAKKEAA